jgi:non-specific serine/threonine protein kinase
LFLESGRWPFVRCRCRRAGAEDDQAAVAASESVHLFVDRARLVLPAFDLDDKSARLVAAICRTLDGIPLAIELAAARTKLLSVEQIHSLLDQRFRLLIGGAGVPPRHRVLETVVGWSYEHLEVAEQEFVRKLSVFAGGWTLAGAAAVAGMDPLEALSLLDRLADKSLISIDRDGGDEPRYGMLQTVAQFMAERLVAHGERDATRMRHLVFYVERAEAIRQTILRLQDEDKVDPVKSTAARSGCLSEFDADRENIATAHRWCDVAEGGAELGLRIVNAVRTYWFVAETYRAYQASRGT